MKKRTIASVLVLAVLSVSLVLSGFIVGGTGDSLSVWKEVEQPREYYRIMAAKEAFDLQKIIMSSDYVFKGTVINTREYEVKWTDEKGEKWGPFRNTVIEVNVSKKYHGNSPVKGNTIKVYYPCSLSEIQEDSVLIHKGGEYIFVTEAFDKDFFARKLPDDRFQQEKHADVYVSDTSYKVLPIEEENILMYCDYFISDSKVMAKTNDVEDINTDKIINEGQDGIFIALEEKDFDKAFTELFKNPEDLPDAKELQDIHKKTDKKG
jgi:hypothetical protein